MRVHLSQQELARRNRCAPSTISWYLRRLGPAVVTRRGGIVFDRAVLAELRTTTSSLAPRTVVVERELLERFARPTADGTLVELLAGGPADPKPASLQDLADELGINRSSAHRHVTALERAGRLERHGRRLYAVPPDRPAKEPNVDHQPHEPAPAGLGLVTPQQVLALLDKVTELLTLVAGMANQFIPASQPATAIDSDPRFVTAHDPRFCGAHSADDDQLRAAAVADQGRGSSSEIDLIDRNDGAITSNQSVSRVAESRPPDQLRAEEPRIEADWSRDDLPGLLAPL
ncbi:MAG: helix-turn-helix domain-containing protein, partial [Actinomycetota bacterium]|nr:helix-turn-helix domain-containing protein [Actinomycetota bacterium]